MEMPPSRKRQLNCRKEVPESVKKVSGISHVDVKR